MSELNVGVIGCGNISTTYFELASLFKGYQFKACADLNHANAEASAATYGLTAMSVDDLLASQDIDVIVNLTIPDSHNEISTRILEAGKHVYSEKPLSLNTDEAKALAALAQQKGLSVGCAPDTFFGGTHQLARKLVDDGAIGTITSGTCHVMSHGMEDWHPNPDFFFQPGAGPVLDLGPYYIAALVNLIGPVKRVGALTSMAEKERMILNGDRHGEMVPVDTPTTIHALLEFHTGATVTLSASWDVWSHEHNNIELYGTEGTLYVPDPNFFAGDLRIARKNSDTESVAPIDHPFDVINEAKDDEKRANYRGAGLADMAMAIHDKRDFRCSIDRAAHALDVMMSILESGETGQFVTINTACTRPDALGADAAMSLLRDKPVSVV